MARWLLTFQAIDPKNHEGKWAVGITENRYKELQIHGHEKQIARLLLVEEVLTGGTALLYEGWSRPDKDDCFVYEGHPSQDYKNLRIVTPAPPNMVFLVFILPDGTIDDWTWRRLDENGSGRPQGIQGKLIWPQNPT